MRNKKTFSAIVIGSLLAFVLIFFGVQRANAQTDDIDPRYSPPASAPAKTTEDLCLERWAQDIDAQKKYCATPEQMKRREQQEKSRIRNMIETKGATNTKPGETLTKNLMAE